ncbi:chaperonin containing t-complex protein 1, alpha subunit, putative [Theileria equi strain WA]|uniref:T-complex protein 1 subunit alpha n=1 Tax=Theileria equi strain WA TaxID=1537102 RepID=L1LB86_THEEQ|nr:chaperonin containing t-complex protein 1, alpha subunit, putative [Theileria equi strain WA]EKX72535.1 chaperonin containing t-complex protein 1, alpha subunit, putative [Theileria equi strain WA]|eukprot:XP_004831987.1 chaperonin containing t-complex protein 1, alpha subunit, putative [Theileria equi strain WA]
MTLGILGQRTSGKEVRAGNVNAVQAIANILKSSLGPKGLDKMLVDDLGDVTITNDGATMLRQLEVQHPAAKLLVDLSELQDQEVGDGTTSVVLIAAELLRRANELANAGIHPTSIISGYKLAIKESVRYIKEHLSKNLDQIGKDVLTNIAKTTLSSKLIGFDSDYFAQMVVQAIQSVKTTSDSGATKYPVNAVNIVKVHGKSARESYMVNGYAIMMGRAAQGMPLSVSNAKIAFLDFAIKQYRLHLGVQVKINDPDELEKIRLKEKDVTKERVEKILASGANVILTSQGIDDMSLKYFVEAGVIAARRVSKKDLKRIAKLTGGTIVLTMATLDGGEAFNSSSLGTCNQVYETRVGDWDCLFFEGCKTSKATTLILRGANDFMIDEVERSVHDALCAVSRALEQDALVPGGGCVETALSIYLDNFARTLGSREQLAIAEFAEALLVIPKTLALNAALDATELVALLRAYHAKAQVSQGAGMNEENYQWYGLNLKDGKIRNNLTSGVLEATVSKIKSIKFATEAAITILRIDDLITLEPEKQPVDDDD